MYEVGEDEAEEYLEEANELSILVRMVLIATIISFAGVKLRRYCPCVSL